METIGVSELTSKMFSYFILIEISLTLFISLTEFISYIYNGLLKFSNRVLIFYIFAAMIVTNIIFSVVYYSLFILTNNYINLFETAYIAFALNFSLPLREDVQTILSNTYIFNIITVIQSVFGKLIELVLIGLILTRLMNALIEMKSK
ncbi:hypothetical protein J42TS3_41430 [Paenibacillus vini]|uniref:Uncharacterized protein n=1 Tax=Paenibacillus vini TaxID=1476024 RepID=A0ABQ4MGJ7_9BACL|nr:hypothetical protein J42TS3_41430 [Paenibacillus vini]